MPKIVIQISEGVLVAVHSSDPETEVVLFDFDNLDFDSPSLEEKCKKAIEGLEEVY